MTRRIGSALTALGIAGGCFAQVGAVPILYGHRLVDFFGILVLSTIIGFALHFALFARWLKPLPALASAGAVALAAAYIGAFLAFNIYGT